MTPTLKLKRNNLMKRHAREIEATHRPETRQGTGSA
jgi:long-chain acyl-CoA synthetase